MFSSLCFADNYKLLNIQKEILNEKIKSYEIQKEINYSRTGLLALKGELFNKQLELLDEKTKITKEYYEKTSRLEELSELKKISNLKISNLKKIKELRNELKKIISENEFFEIESQISEEELTLNVYSMEENQINFILENNSFLLLDKSELSYYNELISTFDIYLNQKEQELKFLISEKRAAYEVEIKNKELEATKINFKEKLIEFEKYNAQLETELEKTNGNLKIIDLKISFYRNKLKNIGNLLKDGVVSQKEYLSEEINLLSLIKEQISLLGAQKAIKMELETRNKKRGS